MKAFTLVELLAVIIILGLIMGITVPTVNKIIEDSKEKTYNEQVSQIESIARNWGVENTNSLPDSGECKLELTTLKDEGLLENKELKNPKDNSVMNGCVVIKFDKSTNQYIYTYTDECNDKEKCN